MKAAILRSPDSVPVYGDFEDPVAGQESEIVELVVAEASTSSPGRWRPAATTAGAESSR